MDDLAAEAGVSKSLVYWYWEGKGALLSELIDTCMNRYIDLLTDAVNSDDPFIDKFYRTLWQYLEISRQSDRLNKLVHKNGPCQCPDQPGAADGQHHQVPQLQDG